MHEEWGQEEMQEVSEKLLLAWLLCDVEMGRVREKRRHVRGKISVTLTQERGRNRREERTEKGEGVNFLPFMRTCTRM